MHREIYTYTVPLPLLLIAIHTNNIYWAKSIVRTITLQNRLHDHSHAHGLYFLHIQTHIIQMNKFVVNSGKRKLLFKMEKIMYLHE